MPTRFGTPITRRSEPDVMRRISSSVDLTPEQHRFLEMYAIQNDKKMAFVVHSLIDLIKSRKDIAEFIIDIIFDPDCPDEISMKDATNKKRLTVHFRGSYHSFLRLFAAQNDTKTAKILRALIYVMSQNDSFKEIVTEGLYAYTESAEPNTDNPLSLI